MFKKLSRLDKTELLLDSMVIVAELGLSLFICKKAGKAVEELKEQMDEVENLLKQINDED